MPQPKPTIAVFPGAFDPITHGHLDLISRAAKLFDKLVIGVGCNPEKQELFSSEERLQMIQQQVGHLPNVEVRAYQGLTMDFVRSIGAKVILRGIRDTVDLRSELQTANTNLMVGNVETIFLMTSDQHALTSSTLIKQIVQLGGYDKQRLIRLLPPEVLEKLHEKFPNSSVPP